MSAPPSLISSAASGSTTVKSSEGTSAAEEDFDLVADWDSLDLPPKEYGEEDWEHVYENGRRYHLYKQGRYLLPNDDREQNREDVKHAMMLELTDGRRHYAPLNDSTEKIIDIGTGTGIWAIEMSDLYPNAQVLGIDLSPIQPTAVPENCRFLVDDCEASWANGYGWDYAHIRNMANVLEDVDKLILQVYEHLKPGGWIEFQELHTMPRCDDGTMKEDDNFLRFAELTATALEANGQHFHKCRMLRGPLTRAGFTNIQIIKRKCPLGEWARDPAMKLVGLYQRYAMEEVISALTGKPFENIGIGRLEREVWAAKARNGLNDRSVHRYFTFYFWIAQKPV